MLPYCYLTSVQDGNIFLILCSEPFSMVLHLSGYKCYMEYMGTSELSEGQNIAMYLRSSVHYNRRLGQTVTQHQKEHRSICVYLGFALPVLRISTGRVWNITNHTHEALNQPYSRRPPFPAHPSRWKRK